MKPLLLAVLLALRLGAQDQKKPEEPRPPLQYKLFILKYANPDKIQNLINILGGSATSTPELHAIAVRATAESLTAIEEAIKRLDVPAAAPQNIELTAYFVAGSDTDAAPGQVPKELDPVMAQLKNAFPFKAYRVLDTLTLRLRSGYGGDSNSVSAAENSQPVYTSLKIGSASVNTEGSAIRIDKLHAALRVPSSTNGMFQDLGLDADVDIKEGQKVVVGRLSMGHNQALFLVLTARVVN